MPYSTIRLVIRFAFFAAAISAGVCVHADIKQNTELAINSEGKIIAIRTVENDIDEVVDIAYLNNTAKPIARRLNLNSQAFTISFGVAPESLLITSRDKYGSNLLMVNVRNLEHPQIRSVYKSKMLLRFPVQLSTGDFVVLEQVDLANGHSRWQIVSKNGSRDAGVKGFRLAGQPSVIGENVFLLVPATPPYIFDITGNAPEQVRQFMASSSHVMVCADAMPLVCVRKNVTVLLTESYAELSVKVDGNICKVPGQWTDSRSLSISRNGAIAVFHARVRGSTERNIYAISVRGSECTAKQINIIKG